MKQPKIQPPCCRSVKDTTGNLLLLLLSFYFLKPHDSKEAALIVQHIT